MRGQHTQGPWAVANDPALSEFSVRAESRGTGFGSSVAICTQRDGEFRPLSRDEAMSNAHLIAAAPDLLEAVRIAIGNVRSLGPAGALEGVQPSTEYIEWLAQLESVYARATGVQS